MANYDATSGAGRLQMDVELYSQNIPSNYSTYRVKLRLFCGNGFSWSNTPVGWEIKIHGWEWYGSYTFDFRSTNEKLITDWLYFDVVHNADGTSPAIGGYGYSQAPGVSAIPGSMQAIINPNIVGPRIPRGPKAENSGGWQNTLAYAEVNGTWQQVLVHAEVNGAWQLVGA